MREIGISLLGLMLAGAIGLSFVFLTRAAVRTRPRAAVNSWFKVIGIVLTCVAVGMIMLIVAALFIPTINWSILR